MSDITFVDAQNPSSTLYMSSRGRLHGGQLILQGSDGY